MPAGNGLNLATSICKQVAEGIISPLVMKCSCQEIFVGFVMYRGVVPGIPSELSALCVVYASLQPMVNDGLV